MGAYDRNGTVLDTVFDLSGVQTAFAYDMDGAAVWEAVEPPADGTVDIVVFGGQSNMVGQGAAAEAPELTAGCGYWYEDGAVSEMEKEGSIVPSFVNLYFRNTKCPVIGIKAAWNGYSTYTYSGTVSTTLETITACREYLASIGKTVRRIMLVWNQGESDAASGVTTEAYVSALEGFKDSFRSAGVQMFFLIKIGQYKSGAVDYSGIRAAYDQLCLEEDTVLVSDKFYGATEHMSDVWHYTQVVYNAVGREAGKNTAYYYNTGERPAVTAWEESTDAV